MKMDNKYDYKLDVDTATSEKEENDKLKKDVYNFLQDKSTATAKLGFVTKTVDSLITFVECLDVERDYYKKELHDSLYYCLEQVCAFRSYIFNDEFEKYQKERSSTSEDNNS